MSKSLVITEKPSVAQEFARILGVSGRNDGYIENSQYVITWCVGHLVEMVYPEQYDEKYKKWRLEDLPFLPREYKYDVIDNVKKQYDIVNRMLHREDIDTVYWAGDAGKEGQTIEENIRRFGGVRPGMKELRVWIDSQTEEEIKRGMREAKDMSAYDNLANSGVMRTIEDYAMGINFSRVMSVKYGRLLNDAAGTRNYTAIAVGRVMTCVLGMVVMREREIRDFTETPFYRVIGSFARAQDNKEAVEAEWRAVEGSAYYASPLLYRENGFKKEESARELIKTLTGRQAEVSSIEQGTARKRAPLLFNLAELQAECAKRFKISPDETLAAAQELYEKKMTTYPRTDARVLSSAVAKEIGKNIGGLKNFSPVSRFAETIAKEGRYKNIAKTMYTDDSKITDHYAIIPTGQLAELERLTALQRSIFELIVRRFLSIFYPPAEYRTAKLTVDVLVAEKTEKFFASARTLKSCGYLEVAGLPGERAGAQKGEEGESDNKALFALAETVKKGDLLHTVGYAVKEGKTSPPKRYTSGSMVLAMENAGQLIEEEELREQIKSTGIGTSATRAEIIKKLVRIGYLALNKKTQVLTPERLGEMVYEVVSLTVPALLNPKMTASWEKGLDGITRGTVVMDDYRGKLEDFIRKETVSMIERDLKSQIAEKILPFVGKEGKVAAKRSLGISCPVCDGTIETTPFGYGCSNYKKEGGGCRFAIGTIAGRDLSDEEVRALLTEGRTPVLSGFTSKKKKKFKAALVLETMEQEGAKEVKINFDFSKNEPETIEGVSCPICGGAIRETSFGFGCANYEKDNPQSCRFSVGKMAGKSLSLTNIKDLLTDGRSGVIRGFQSKGGKKFDARIALAKDEEGKVTGLRFDFDDIAPQKLRGVVCPKCGGEIIKTPFGYGCANYEKDNPQSCRFMIGRVASVKLKEAQVKELLTNKKTGMIEGFVAKTGMKFDAPLKLTAEGDVAFDFPEKPKPIATQIDCPRCHLKLMREQWHYTCNCGFKLMHTVAKVALKEEQIKELLETGETKERVTGFLSKKGNAFDAYLKYEDGNIKFEFDKTPNMAKKSEYGPDHSVSDTMEMSHTSSSRLAD